MQATPVRATTQDTAAAAKATQVALSKRFSQLPCRQGRGSQLEWLQMHQQGGDTLRDKCQPSARPVVVLLELPAWVRQIWKHSLHMKNRCAAKLFTAAEGTPACMTLLATNNLLAEDHLS